jgi:hypothetical protein
MLLRCSVVLGLLLTGIASPGTSERLSLRQNQPRPQANARASLPPTGWFIRPPEAGDYEIALSFPDVERPPELAKYWPMDRDLPGTCGALKLAYRDALTTGRNELAALENRHLSDLDPETLQLPRLYERVGRLAAYSGDMERAISSLESAYRSLNQVADFLPNGSQIKLTMEEEIGVAYMKLGEQQNCRLNHNAEMCIIPLSVQGQHKLKTGSEKAIEYFNKYLETDPKSLEVRWLLNIACMTLGKYPSGVPSQFLIPPAAFESKEDIGRFTDVAATVGIDNVGDAGGVVMDDFDNDGFLDIIISSTDPCDSLHYYHNNGDGTFSDWTKRSGLSEQPGGLNLIQTDYNNDGWLDLFVMRGGWDLPMHNSLLRNNGDGTFTDVTVQSGLDSGAYRTHSVAWADFDNDGFVDVFIGHEDGPSQLFRNKGDGTFEDVSHVAGVDKTAFTKGAVWGDYDNDGYPDLFVSNYGGEKFLYHNNRNGTFTDLAKQLHIEKPLMSFTCWFFDYDNDGYLDLFIASFPPSVTEVARGYLGLPPHGETMKLYRNTGKGAFEDVTKAVKLDRVLPTMGANFGDLDNDGYLDFYLGTGTPSYAALVPNIMYRNHDGKYFVDVTTSTGTGHLQKGHGIAFGDINNDGNQDIFINIGGAVPGDAYNKALFANPGHSNHWLSVKLSGVKTNRAAIGAKIKVTLEDEKGNTSLRYREVTSGGSFGASPLTQAIGLGKAARIKSLEVIWPASKTTQVFQDVAMDQFIEVKELENNYVKRQLRSFPLGSGEAQAQHEHLH